MPQISRRDFLKLASLVSGTVAAAKFAPELLGSGSPQGSDLPNVIILVFDAMSARNLSVYGYPRRTSPNFEEFAERATVYHAHHSGGNFTTPGTASLLTGTYPWTHRAFDIAALIERDRIDHNIFRGFGDPYHRLAFSQNLLPNYFFGQFRDSLAAILPPGSFSRLDQVSGDGFPHDLTTGYRAFDNFLFQDGMPPASLVFGLADRVRLRYREARTLSNDYPGSLPRAGDHPIFFELKEVFDGLRATLDALGRARPFLAYLHLWAPHSPYRPSKHFSNLFEDMWGPEPKPYHRLGDQIPYSKLNARRQNYDEYIANVDDEFGKLIDALANSGLLEQSYVVVTSDHGESLERGVDGHVTKLLYEPLTHIPLLIAAPGQKTRQDIQAPTNSVDLLPTLMHLAGREVPDWTEGRLLPGLGGEPDVGRSTFTVEAKTNPAFAPLTSATIAMIKGNYKMIYYTGYELEDSFELYDLESDPQEVRDLYPGRPAFAGALRDELLEKLDSVNAHYRRS
jgi:arylsulfatase A-like enzyme